MATVNEKLTAINNEIRTMTNTTAPLGLDAMKDHLADANEEISEQDALVEQLISAMAGKSVPGGGSGGAVETCTVTIENTSTANVSVIYWSSDNGSDCVSKREFVTTNRVVLDNVVCNRYVAVVPEFGEGYMNDYSINGDCEGLYSIVIDSSGLREACFFMANSPGNITITLSYFNPYE